MYKKLLLLPLIPAMVLAGCATYHLSTQSLLEQFAGSRKEQKVTVLIAPPYLFYPGIVEGNNLRRIKCYDKAGKEVTLPVTKHTGIRFTKENGSKTTFYFDTLLLKDSTVTGSNTHFFNAQIRPIKFSEISRIELQR